MQRRRADTTARLRATLAGVQRVVRVGMRLDRLCVMTVRAYVNVPRDKPKNTANFLPLGDPHPISFSHGRPERLTGDR